MTARAAEVDVLVVGGGIAGATLATRLARSGIDVRLVERSPTWRWRASGVFASPAAVDGLRDLGLDGDAIRRVARPIPAMRLETPGGAVVRLTYDAEARHEMAVGFDRSALDPHLLALARDAGARVDLGSTVTDVTLTRGRPRLMVRTDGHEETVRPRIVVGADGAHSLVARVAGVARPTRLPARVGLSFHLVDARPDAPVDARMRLLDDGYVGIAPVPHRRVNIGIVLGPSWRARLATEGAQAVVGRIVADVPPVGDDPATWRHGSRLDDISGASPLGVRVTRRAGPGWLLVGDAAGFLDPFTGEGIHRALVSADLGARAIAAALGVAGVARGTRVDPDRAMAAYDRSMRRRFATKDAVSWLVQAFLGRPTMFEYAARRLGSRDDVRATMGLVMGDLVPARRGLDPRFLASLLAP